MSRYGSSTISQSLLFALRVCVLSCSLFIFSYMKYNGQITEDELNIGFLVIAILFAFSMFSGFYLIRFFNAITSKFCLFVDSVIISGLIYLSGLYYSQLITIYVLIVGISTAIFGAKSGLWQVLFNMLIYQILVGLAFTGIIPKFGELADSLPTYQSLISQILTLTFASVIVVIFSSLLIDRVSRLIADLNAREKQLEKVELDSETVLEQLPIAVVICDDNERILKLSKNTRNIIGINLNVKQKLFEQLKCESHKEELVIKSSSGNTTLKISRREIHLASEPRAKIIYSFEDISKLKQAEETLAQKSRTISLGVNLTASSSYNIIGESEKIKDVIKVIEKYGKTNSNILVLGESGTGKELVAKAIHQSSDRNNKPFIAVNCGAIPESLIESALFGHQKGSFTGATGDQSGYFTQANGGTLFLDEIGELPIHMQPKLLRALQEKKIRRIGAKNEEEVDVRIVAATNRELKQEVNKGNFREDLYYRLNVLAIKLPALRERKEDLEPLIAFFSNLTSSRSIRITEEALNLLKTYNFPGNIRELENIIERAIVLCKDEIGVEHLPQELSSITPSFDQSTESNTVTLPVDLDSIVSEMERLYVQQAMSKSGGVKKIAAELLGINLRSLRYRLDKLGSGEWWFDS